MGRYQRIPLSFSHCGAAERLLHFLELEGSAIMEPRQVAQDVLCYDFSLDALAPEDHPKRSTDRSARSSRRTMRVRARLSARRSATRPSH
jgi:hypothetical protein